MKTLTPILVIVAALVLCGCYAPVGAEMAAGGERSAIVLPVLADMIVGADKSGGLVRFVDLRPPEIDRLRELCGPRFQIRSVDESESSAGVLRLKGGNQVGVHITVEVTRIGGGEAQARGTYLHVGSFAFLGYKLRFTEGAWHIVSHEFIGAS
jgi:hypothetical protein